MIEVTGDLWTYPADVRVITTNGTVKKNGECVMGRGCAWEAKQKWPELAGALGNAITLLGNYPHQFGPMHYGQIIITFPIKHKWMEKADLKLIEHSACLLVQDFADQHPEWKTIVVPRSGCGNGQLLWEDVKAVLAPILDDRFYVITKP